MQESPKRIMANGTVGAVTTFSILGWVLPAVFRLLDWAGAAADTEWAWTLFAHPSLNWNGIYLALSFVGSGVLLALNWGLVWEPVSSWLSRRRSAWDWSLRDAVYYLAHNSKLGEGHKEQAAFALAVTALENAGRAGKIKFSARRPGSTDYENVHRSIWVGASISVESVASIHEGAGGKIVQTSNTQTVLYEGLRVDSLAVATLWPRRRHPNGELLEPRM